MNAAGPGGFLVVGSGLAAWMTAAALARTTDGASVAVLAADDSVHGLPTGLAENALPSAEGVLHGLLADEADAVTGTGGSYSFGIAMSGWSHPEQTYFHPFGSVGAEYGPVAFHAIVQRLRRGGVEARFGNYSLAAMAAQAGRFQRPDGDPRSVLSTCRYGLHLDPERLAQRFRAEAEAAGVRVLRGRFNSVTLSEDGAIAAVETDRGESLQAALYVDCSGARGRLVGALDGAGWEDWSGWLRCDRYVEARFETPEAPLPYSHAEARAGGWTRYLPLQQRTVLAGFWCAEHDSEEAVLRRFRAFAGRDAAATATGRLQYGRRQRPWRHNCVALGAAATVIDPVGLSNLHLLGSAVRRLVSLLPGSAARDVLAAEYNRQSAAELAHARDFALMHYRLNGRNGEPFWDQARRMAVPASAGYKLQLYANLGRVAMYDFEPLEEISWINLFDEHGVQPRQLHPIAEGVSLDELRKHADKVRTVMMGALRNMPLHADYLARLGPARGTEPQRKRET